jgi:hypothetical protein
MRTVACGLRVKFIGTNDNMGGQVFAYRDPDNSNILNESFQDITTAQMTTVHDFNREWVTVIWAPTTKEDFEYSQFTTSTSENCMGLLIKSALPAQPFAWEIIWYVESIGRVVSSVTPTHADAVGMAAVQQASQKGHYSYEGDGPSWSELLSQAGAAVRSATHFVSKHAGDLRAIGGAAQAAYSGRVDQLLLTL